MANPKLKAEPRKTLGRKVKKLRADGLLPATVYGRDVKSQSLKFDYRNFLKVFDKVGETGIVDLDIKGEKKARPVLINSVQLDPVTDKPLHVEFRQVDLTKKVSVNIPIELKGEAPAAEKGGVLVHMLNEVEVEALPGNLPESIEVDITGLKEIGDAILVKDLDYNKDKLSLKVEDEEIPVVRIEEPREEEEEPEPEVAVEGEVPVEGEPTEGETPAETETKPEGAQTQKQTEKKEEK